MFFARSLAKKTQDGQFIDRDYRKNGAAGGRHRACLVFRVRGYLLALLICFQLGSARGSDCPSLPFQFKDGFAWVEVKSPQAVRPLRFLLDSGAATSVLNLTLANRLGLQKGKSVTVRGVGSKVQGFYPAHLQGSLANISIPHQLLVVDLSALAQECKCDVDGLLGADFFKGRVVQIDFASRTIRLPNSAVVLSEAEVLPVMMDDGPLRVRVRLNGQSGIVRLDTGCASSLHWVTQQTARQGPVKRSVGLTSISRSTAVGDVELGRSLFTNTPIDLHRTEIFPGESGLLGMGILANFKLVTIDGRAHRLVLQ